MGNTKQPLAVNTRQWYSYHCNWVFCSNTVYFYLLSKTLRLQTVHEQQRSICQMSKTRVKLYSSAISNKWRRENFPNGLDGKGSACNVGNLCSIPGSGRSPGEGNGNPLQRRIRPQRLMMRLENVHTALWILLIQDNYTIIQCSQRPQKQHIT